MRLLRSKCFYFVFTIMTLAAYSYGEKATGTLVGTVHNASGAVVPGTKVVATNIATNTSDETATNTWGDYTFSSLDVGVYTLHFSAPSFQPLDVEKIEIHAATSIRQDATLSPTGPTNKVKTGGVALQPQSATADTDIGVLEPAETALNKRTQTVGGFWNDEWGLRIGGAYPDEGPGGATFTAVGHPNWVVLQPSVPYNSQEVNIYGTAAQGQATSVAGTNQLTYVRGSPFTSDWIGLPFFYFNGGHYKVLSVDGSRLALANLDGQRLRFPSNVTNDFHFVASTTETRCNVHGSSVTRVSGNPFIPFAGGSVLATVKISGKVYDVIGATQKALTLATSGGTQNGATCYGYINVYDEITNLRVQKMWGGDEENLAIMSRATGTYEIRSLIAGYGKYLPIYMGSGAAGAALYNQIVIHEDGFLSLGNGYGADVLRIQGSDGTHATHFLFVGATQNTKSSPSIAARTNTTDTNVGLSFDTLGTGSTTFTSHGYGNAEFQIFGGGAANYLAVGSDAASPTLSANGSSKDVNVRLAPKGTGLVISTAPVQLPSYVVKSLPACNAASIGAEVYASNARNSGESAEVGTGSIVACDGTKWKIPGVATAVTY